MYLKGLPHKPKTIRLSGLYNFQPMELAQNFKLNPTQHSCLEGKLKQSECLCFSTSGVSEYK